MHINTPWPQCADTQTEALLINLLWLALSEKQFMNTTTTNGPYFICNELNQTKLIFEDWFPRSHQVTVFPPHCKI